MEKSRDQVGAEGRIKLQTDGGSGDRLLWWYSPEGMVEGDSNGPFPWLVERSEVIELRAVGSPGSGRVGDASELEFMGRACRLDFRVAKPWGNVDPYDVLVAMGRDFWRVQVKCAHRGKDGCYYAGCGRRAYSKNNIDFVAAHLVAPNIWYIVPVEACEGRRGLHFGPYGTGKAKYERYREAWCLLACTRKARGYRDIPVLCRCRELPVRCAVCPRRESANETRNPSTTHTRRSSAILPLRRDPRK